MHWIVDGMNVIGSRPDGWWRDRRAAMETLVGQLESWISDTEHDSVTVVFERPPSPPLVSASVTVTCAPEPAPNSADDEIVRLVAACPDPGDICVVTSDGGLVSRVETAGASVFPAKRFRDLINP